MLAVADLLDFVERDVVTGDVGDVAGISLQAADRDHRPQV
jgi:hypothetical protein